MPCATAILFCETRTVFLSSSSVDGEREKGREWASCFARRKKKIAVVRERDGLFISYLELQRKKDPQSTFPTEFHACASIAQLLCRGVGDVKCDSRQRRRKHDNPAD